ncbi:MAG: hypothetical protein GXO79_03260 [Chlorobi bacterium]|nr:hypothetical protein [Chlorobiota bacterium]
MIKEVIFIFLITEIFLFDCFGQTNRSYIPVTINSPFFNQNDEIQVGAKINNYGLNCNIAGQLNSNILIVGLQYNTGQFGFDPLNFNDYYEQGEATHLIQSKPSEMLYCEIGFGYNYEHKKQKLSLLTGIGQQFINLNTRLFVQFDWGNESRLINAGVSLRGNYTIVANKNLITLEPVVQGKVKIWNFRIVNQFGYSIAIRKNEDYMKPILTIGLEYIIGNSAHNKLNKT